MNKTLKQYFAAISITIAVVVFVLMVMSIVKSPFNSYMSETRKSDSNIKKISDYEKQKKEQEDIELRETNQLKQLKPIYETTADSSVNSTGVYGTMFDEVIKLAQSNGLLIRSIEYDMNPTYDPIFAGYSDQYNACEFKFFFIGSYNQLKSFLNDINTQFKNFISISKLNVTAFEENPDYLLVHISFTLYSKKNLSGGNKSNIFSGQNNARKGGNIKI